MFRIVLSFFLFSLPVIKDGKRNKKEKGQFISGDFVIDGNISCNSRVLKVQIFYIHDIFYCKYLDIIFQYLLVKCFVGVKLQKMLLLNYKCFKTLSVLLII